MVKLHPVKPVKVELPDGTRVNIRLTWKALRRVSERFGKPVSELFRDLNDDTIVVALYEAIEEKGELTIEQFREIIENCSPAAVGELFEQLSPNKMAGDAGKEPSASG